MIQEPLLFFSPFFFFILFTGMSLPSSPSLSSQLLHSCSTLHPQPTLHMETPNTDTHIHTERDMHSHTHIHRDRHTHTNTRTCTYEGLGMNICNPRGLEDPIPQSILDSFLLQLVNWGLVCSISTWLVPSYQPLLFMPCCLGHKERRHCESSLGSNW